METSSGTVLTVRVDSLASRPVSASFELAVAAIEVTGRHRASVHLTEGCAGVGRFDTVVAGAIGESIDLRGSGVERAVRTVATGGVGRLLPLRALALPDRIEHHGLHLRGAAVCPLRSLDTVVGALVVWTEQDDELEPCDRAHVERVATLIGIGVGQEVDRRSRSSVREIGGLVIDLVDRTVTLQGRTVRLTPIEATILGLLSERPGRPVTRERIVQQLFGSTHVGESRAADVHIKNLRLKLKDDSSIQRWIVTMRGVGYALRTS